MTKYCYKRPPVPRPSSDRTGPDQREGVCVFCNSLQSTSVFSYKRSPSFLHNWQVTYDLPLLETSKVYSGFLNDGVLLLNVWFSQLQVRMVNALSGTSKRVCLTTIHVLFSSSHTQFLLYVSLIAQLCIYISKCPCPCYWPCGFCGRTYKISCKSQICV